MDCFTRSRKDNLFAHIEGLFIAHTVLMDCFTHLRRYNLLRILMDCFTRSRKDNLFAHIKGLFIAHTILMDCFTHLRRDNLFAHTHGLFYVIARGQLIAAHCWIVNLLLRGSNLIAHKCTVIRDCEGTVILCTGIHVLSNAIARGKLFCAVVDC